MTRVLGLDPTNVESMSNAYIKIYDQIPQLLEFFRKYVPGCETSYLVEIAPMLGVRESRRIMGDYLLDAEDLLEGKVFADAVSMGRYHIDFHRPSGSWVDSRNVKAYTIPLRSLIARDVEGLMMAGKCLSATHEAVASTRVIPIYMGQGEAVGTAAALAIKNKTTVRELDTQRLQDQLDMQGAELGQSVRPPNQKAIDEYGQLPLEAAPTEGEMDAVTADPKHWIK